MVILQRAVQYFEAETEGVHEIPLITTPYTDKKIPIPTILLLVFSVLLLIAFAVVTFILIRKRTKNWGYSLIVGLAAYLVFVYALNMVVLFGVNYIPGLSTYFETHMLVYNLIMMVFAFLFETLAVLVGLKIYQSTAEKRELAPELGAPLIYGFAFYLAAILVSQQLTYSFEYVMVCASINQMGFDTAVSAMVDGGIAEEEAISSLLALTDQNPVEYLLDSFVFMAKACIQTSAIVLTYGVYNKKLEKKFLGAALGLLAAYYIPSIISFFVELPTIVMFIMTILIGAAVVFVAYRIVSKYMPDDLRELLVIKQQSGGKKGSSKQQKMPKIVMPKD